MLLSVVVLILSLVVLVVSADRFVEGGAAFARHFNVSPMLIGITILGFGTSAPEMLVSAIAAWEGNSGLAVGNVLGSNIANIGLILGCTIALKPIAIHPGILRREMPVLLLVTILAYVLVLDGSLDHIDGIALAAVLTGFLYWLIRSARLARSDDATVQNFEEDMPEPMSQQKSLLLMGLGLIALILSSKALVWAAVEIALAWGVSDLVIGLTIVALGTSLPELAASIASVMKDQGDMAVGNVIGSNIYNLAAVLAIPALINPGEFQAEVLSRDFPIMIGLTCFLFLLILDVFKRGKIGRFSGFSLISAYLTYQILIYRSVMVL